VREIRIRLDFLHKRIKLEEIKMCELCFKPISFGLDSLEHFDPICRGGTNDFWNLAVAHLKCNYKKSFRTMDEWFRLNPNPSSI